MRRPNRASSARRQKPDKPSQRIQRIELNEHEEQRIQNLYAPLPLARNPNISIRHLDLNQLRQLARANRQPSLPLPTLASLCATVAARTFPTWILPSQDTFQRAKHAHHRPSAAATTSASPPKKRRRTTRDANRPFGATTRLDQDHSGDYVEPDGKATDGATRTSSRRSKRTRNDAGPSAQSPSANTCGSTSVPSDAPLLLPDELEQLTRRNAALLKMLPSQSSFALFQAMCLHCPEMLSRAVVSTYFLPTAPSSPSSASSTLRAPRTHVLMPASLPLFASGGASDAPMLLSTMASALSSHAARSLTNAAVFGQAAFSLTSLQLHGLTGLKDPSLVRLFTAHLDATDKTRAGGSATTTAAISDAGSRGPLRLEVVSLKGCVRIGDAAVAALCGGSGSTLKYLNLDCTDITAKSLEAILVGAPQIETLKLGDVDGLTDDTVPPAVERASETALACRSPFVPLSRLTNLRLRRTQVGDLALGSLLKHCARTLQRLDVSYSLIGSADGELDVLAFALGLDAARGRSLHRRCAGMRNELTGGSVLEDDSWIKDLLDGGRGSAQAVDFDGAAGGASASTTAPPQRRGRGRRQQEQQQQKQRQQQQQAAEVAAREAPPRCDLIKLNISGLTLTPLGLGSFLFSLCAPSRIDEEPLDDESGADHARQRGDGNGTGHRDGDGDGDGGHEGESGKRGAAGAAGTPSPPVPPAAVGLHTLLLADLRRPDPSSTQSGRRGVQWDDDDVVNILVPLYLLVKHRRGRGFKSVSLAGTEVIASFVCAVAFMPAWLDIERLLVRDDMGDMLPTAFMACLVAFLAGCCEVS
ncbi:uncharacterized protein PSFLO_07190 [Pseudozyma flocculosa]|uniref:RNI-like protein n=1 Tax=Pseudozyma flocculosa TaxID=84751 RepID=A0A5C3FBE5_9BASI|nr:uncharacterized protein PSFLO_07190 [Pseudozyma flocculosa]